MKKIKLLNQEYELVTEYKECFDLEAVEHLFTEYFREFDYVLGDYAYGKLRLKGFCNAGSKKTTNINNYEMVDEYIKRYCAYECKYFIIKKI